MKNFYLIIILIIIILLLLKKESFTGFRKCGGLTEFRNDTNLFPYYTKKMLTFFRPNLLYLRMN
jgi:hypothetical protein